MGHTRVKTKYTVEGDYGTRSERTLYADHSSVTDSVAFYWEDGEPFFTTDEEHNNLIDAINRLYAPFKNSNGELIEGVERFNSTTDPQIK